LLVVNHKKMNFKLLLPILFIVSFFKLNGQTETKPSWSAEYSKSKSFIENQGQFDSEETASTGKIQFAVDFGATRIFFGEKGVSYNFMEALKIPKAEREKYQNLPETNGIDHRAKEKLIGKFKFKTDEVGMTWQGCKSSVKLIGVNQTEDYHNYSAKDKNGEYQYYSKVKGFEKLLYKNLYPNIDVEYIVHPEIGIKYAMIIHPGADPSLVNMVFDKDISLLEGKIHIPTSFGDILDHEPITFYQNDNSLIVDSKFVQSGRNISFSIADYDRTKTLIIDPWTQTPAFNTNWDVVWECEKDGTGNVYILGGIMPMQILKYNSTGTLQWTYSTPYDTSNVWLGTFAVDNAGNSYVTAGSSAQIQKISTAGAVTWNNTSPGGLLALTEFWTITFNCDQTKLVIGGTDGNAFGGPKPYIFDVNMATGNVISTVQVHESVLFNDQEIRAITPCNNSKYYYVTQDSIGYIYQNFTFCPADPEAFHTTNGFNLGYKCENYRYDNSGIMAIAHYNGFVYVHRGNQLQKRNFADASIVSTVAIPGGAYTTSGFGNSVGCSGIDIDDCGNIYVGSVNGVYKFNQSLVQTGNYVTAFNVYDVEVSSSGDIIACGGTGNSSSSSRSGGIQSFAAAACAPQAIVCCDASVCAPDDVCVNDSPITLTPATAGGTWSGTGVTAGGVFTPSTVGVGSTVLTYTLACGSQSITIVVSSCTSLEVCEESNNDLTVTGGVGPYTWATWIAPTSTAITNQTQCQACGYTWFFGSCLNGVTPVTTCNTPGYWSTFATGTTVTPPGGATSIQITDGAGNTLVFDPATVVACITNPCPTITVSTTSQTNVLCFGNSTGAATVSASGGAASYTYTWTPGSLNGASQSNLAAGVYTINVVDANLCPGSGTVTITQPAAAISASASSTPTNCGSSTGTATATPAGGTGSYTYSWSPSGGNSAIAPNLAAGPYVVTVTDGNGCQTTANTTVTTNGGPTISVVSFQDISCFGAADGSATVSGSGGSGTLSYSWMPGSLTGTSQTGLSANSYTVTVTDGGGCTNSASFTIAEPTEIILSSSNIVSANCGVNDGAATVNASGGSGGYLYSWSPTGGSAATASNIPGGVYTVDVDDSDGCTSSISIVVPSIGGPTVTLTSSTDVSCFGDNDGTATVSATGGTAPYTYAWTPTGGSSASATALTAGTYNVAVTDDIGCIGSVSVTIGEPSQIAITETISPVICGTIDGQISTSVTGGSGSYTYDWTPNGESTTSLTGLIAGTYGLTVTDSDGCSQTESYIVGTTGSLTITASPVSTTIQAGETVQLNASGATSYIWTPSTGLDCFDCPDPIASPTQTTIYTVTGTDSSGCTGVDYATVFVTQICGDIFIPTVFSPNGTGPTANNTLCVYGSCISELQYAVYNRWGEKVFETTDSNICWDGMYKDKPLNSGVFAYKLIVTLFDGTYIEESGNLTLIR